MLNSKNTEKCRRIASHYGCENQLIQLAEECGELATACLHRRRNRKSKDTLDNLVEEIADVLVMIEQIRIVEGIKGRTIIESIERKLDRQIGRINDENRNY